MSLKETYNAITRWPDIGSRDEGSIADQLTSADPRLLPETVGQMARDFAEMPDPEELLRPRGSEMPNATDLLRVVLSDVGPYARMRFYLTALDSGMFSWGQAGRMFPLVWSVSRIHRADPRLFTLWERIYRECHRSPWLDAPFPQGRYIKVFRGQDAVSSHGYSWTTSLDVAKRYATGEASGRANEAPVILSGRVASRLVYAYISKAGEEELITAPVNVRSSPRDGAHVERLAA